MPLNFGFIILFLASGTSAVLGNLLLKTGMNNLGGFDISLNNLVPTILKLANSWQLIVGFMLYGFSSLLYLKLITSGEVTKIYPMVVSYMFIVLLLLGTVFLRESFTWTKVFGIFIILAGIFFVSK